MPFVKRSESSLISGDYQHRALLRGHPVQRSWHAAKLDLIQTLLGPHPAKPILDAGCGSGVMSAHLAAAGVPVLGVDLNRNAIEYARRTFGRPQLTFAAASIFEVRDGGFGTLVCCECIEHFPESRAAALLHHLRSLVAPDATLILTTPNYRSAWPFIEFALDRMHLAPRLRDDQHLSRFDPAKLRRFLLQAGWDPVEMGSFNGLAPFLALWSEPAARRSQQRLLRTPRRRTRLHRNLLYARCQAVAAPAANGVEPHEACP